MRIVDFLIHRVIGSHCWITIYITSLIHLANSPSAICENLRCILRIKARSVLHFWPFFLLFSYLPVCFFLICFLFTCKNVILVCLFVLLLGAGGVGGLDQGEELHPGSSGLWEGPEQCTEVTSETQDSGWRTAGSPVAAAGVCAHVCLCFYVCVSESAPAVPRVSVLNFMYFSTL